MDFFRQFAFASQQEQKLQQEIFLSSSVEILLQLKIFRTVAFDCERKHKDWRFNISRNFPIIA